MANGQDLSQAPIPTSVPYTQAVQPIDANTALQQLQTLSRGMQSVLPQQAGGTVPFMPQSSIQPNMPVAPQMVPMQQMQQMPTGQGATQQDRKIVNAQNWGALLGNAIGQVANKKLQENYQKNVKTVADATNYLQAMKNAQQLKAMYPNDPQIQQMADAAIAQNKQGWETLTSDEKTRKMIGKSLNWDFTDPQSMQTPEVKAGQAGIKLATEQQKSGIAATTPQDKKIQDILQQAQQGAKAVGQMGQGIGTVPGAPAQSNLASGRSLAGEQGMSPAIQQAQAQQAAQNAPGITPPQVNMGGQQPPQMPQQQGGSNVRPQDRMEQYLAQLPTNLVPNPAYAAQIAFEEKMFNTIMPRLGGELIRQQGQDYRQNVKTGMDWGKAQLEANTKLQLADKNNQARLDVQTRKNAATVIQAQYRAASIGLGMGDPKTAGAASFAARVELKNTDNAIHQSYQNIQSTEQAISKMQTDADMAYKSGEKARGDALADQIKAAKASIDNERDFIDQMTEHRNKMMDAANSAPVGASGAPGQGSGGGQTDDLLSKAGLGGTGGGGVGMTPSQASGMGGTGGATFGATGDLAPAVGKNPQLLNQWSGAINTYAQKYNVDPNLVASVMHRESSGKANAVSPTGVVGLMQLTQGTAKDMGVDRNNPVENIEGGTKYLAQLIQKRNGDVALALGDYYGWAHKDVGAYISGVLGEYSRRGGTFNPQSAQFASGNFPGTGEAQDAAKKAGAPKPAAGATPSAAQSGPYARAEGGFRFGPFVIGGKEVSPAAKPPAVKEGDDDSASTEADAINKKQYGNSSIDLATE